MWLWPIITSEEEAKKAVKSGAYAAAFIAGGTGILAIIAIATKKPIVQIDGWGLVDALLFAVIAWRIFRFSYLWAMFGLLLYFWEMYWRWSKSGPKGNLIITGMIVLTLVAGVRGTAFLNKIERPMAVIVAIVFAITFSMAVSQSVLGSR